LKLTLKHTAELLHANFAGPSINATFDHVSIDSRSWNNGPDTLFFALKGPNNNAHRFIADLIARGVKNFVVSERQDYPGVNFIVVENTTGALQQLAASHRNSFGFPVIGITGSNGKTIVKEWLNFLLSPDYNIIKSPKSYNSQIGVPLSVLGINSLHNLGIFEAGISKPDEMQQLAGIISPTLGVLTNLGTAHDEGFTSIRQKAEEKLKLFAGCEMLISRQRYLQHHPAPCPTFTWDSALGADVLVKWQSTSERETTVTMTHGGKEILFTIPFTDEASVENAVTSAMVMIYLGVSDRVISRRLQGLYPVEMRLMVKDGVNQTTLIDDSYSADFQSLKIALDFLAHQKQHAATCVILSDIFQSGLSQSKLYADVAALLKANGISRIIGVGQQIKELSKYFPDITLFETTEDLVRDFLVLEFEDETILIKGAREYRFEQIVALLEEKTHETVLEINLNAIAHNLAYYRSHLKPKTRIMVMVKAFGYGSGGFEIARLLEHHQIDYLGVAFADEGISLRAQGVKAPIMVLNPESTSFRSIIRSGLEPEIYSLRGLKAFLRIAETDKISNYPIHIKVDTGMHRLGFQESDLQALTALLKENPSVKVQSILSHLAASDDANLREFSLTQIAAFERFSTKLISDLNISPIMHILNTAGISHFPEAHYDMVRLGIGLYGIASDPQEQKCLENVGTLKSVISQLRTIPAGESVSYGRKFMAQKPTLIATIPVGYADGIPRHWGNQVGYVTIRGCKAPIVGSICMDMLMVDCTGISCAEGDVVILFGETPSVKEIAQKLNTIPYEILTGISQRVKRVFFRE
jgi:Alr-MurF fusion protein